MSRIYVTDKTHSTRIRYLRVSTFHEIAQKTIKLLALATLLTGSLTSSISAKSPVANIDYAAFLDQHDMIWDRTPHRWEVAPYLGNGNIGFLFYKHMSDPANAISIHLGRHDYYDHRLPVDGDDHLWIYRGRLPLGRFQITAKGEIVSLLSKGLSLYEKKRAASPPAPT